MRLLELLVESVLLYRAEVWGCGGQLGPVEKIQMWAARISLGVGRLHPSVSLLFEMHMLPLKWEAARRAIDFWVQVMRMDENRLVKVVILEALDMGSKVRWVENLKQSSMEELGWMGVGLEELGRLSNGEVVQMLRDSIWRAVKESWVAQAEQHSKPKVVREMMKSQCKTRCADIGCT